MCGIVGIVSQDEFNARELLERLKRLEYRGYDSYGYHLGSELRRAVGSIVVKEGKNGKQGIAHTRWATHGGVSERNAHPHTSCDGRIVIAHNGIIENFDEIKRDLVRKGHRFTSETDSEIVAHFFEEGLKHKPINAVAVDFFKRVAGTFGVLMTIRGDEKIYVLKRDSPLVLGVKKGKNIVASDVYAFSDMTDQAVFFENDEFAAIGSDSFQFFNRKGTAIRKPIQKFEWEREKTSRIVAKHHMLKEIHEEPQAVERMLFSLDHEQKKDFETLVRLVRNSKKVIFAACGTSYHASLLGAYYLHRVGVESQTLIASEFRYFANVDKDTLIIPLSQSGETMDVIDALKYAKEQGGKIAAVVNVPYSSIQRMSSLSLNILAGQEICVASTKAFVNQAVLLLKLAQRFGFKVNTDNIPDRIRGVFRKKNEILAIADGLVSSKDLYLIGRGLTYPVARETALKIKETSYIHAEGMMGGELKHGTIALIEKGTPVICLANNSDPDIISNAKEVEARGARIITITNNPVLGRKKGAFMIRTANDGKFGILAAVAGQLIAYFTADKLGRPIDKPRNLAKSVTVK